MWIQKIKPPLLFSRFAQESKVLKTNKLTSLFFSKLLKPWIPALRARMTAGGMMLLLSSIYSLNVFALDTDRDLPLITESNSATLNHDTKIATFINAVKADQGTTHLTADKLVVIADNKHHVKEAIAYGKLATYRTIPQLNKPEMHAEAEQIQYFPDEKKVILIGNAKVTQDKDLFTGPRIEYDTVRQIVISPPSADGRTHIVLQPKSKGSK